MTVALLAYGQSGIELIDTANFFRITLS